MERKKDNTILAVILAAGLGKRIGKPKWELEINGKTFLEIIQEKLRDAGLNKIVAVIRKSFNCNIKGLDYVVNKKPENGMISSIYYAFHSFPDYDNYLIMPVDHPFVEVNTVETLLACINKENVQAVIRPAYDGRFGHPVIVPGNLMAKISDKGMEGGLRTLIYDSKQPLYNIDVKDSNILKNVNTKEAIEHLI